MRISDWSSDVCSYDLTLSLVLAGDAAPRDWRTGKARPFDIFDAKAEALAALAAAGAPVERLQVIAPAGPAYHPGRSGKLCLGPKQSSEERRVGQECVSTCRSRWSPYN